MSAAHRGTRRRADLSQHFLRSAALAASLVTQASITRKDLVVEIGSGRGTLTRELARRCRKLIAVEFDERLYDELRARFRDDGHVSVVHDDFLQIDLPSGAYKVVGNIPYGRTSEIVRKLVGARLPPTDAYLVVQREAAERFAGRPYAPETRPSLLLKPWIHIEIVRRLRRTDFDPPPRVESVVLWLARRGRPLLEASHTAAYRDFIHACFGRGGNTGRCLRVAFTRRQISRLSGDLGFEPLAPPSTLTFDQWLGLFRFSTVTGSQA